MNRFLRLATLLSVLLLSISPILSRAQDAPPPPPQDPNAPGGPAPDDDQDVSFQTFYDQLGDQDGNWIQTDDYGYVFQPNVQDPNWAPYTDGHWVYTDEGWTWVSDEPWGWATYHYGRWSNIDGTGWVWIPGYRWAPAWVSWRFGGGYVGWAPLPPDPGFGGGGDYHYGSDVDASFHIGAGWYNFVPESRIGDSNLRGAFISRRQNFTVIHNTQNITNINISGTQGGRGGFGGIAANGPPLAQINAHATHHVATMQLNMASAPGRSSVQGNSLSIYAPKVNASTAKQGRPAAVAATIAHPTFNRGQSATKPIKAHTAVRNTGTANTPAAANAPGANHAPQAYHPENAPAANTAPVNHTQQTFHPEAAPGANTESENRTQTPQTYHPQTAPAQNTAPETRTQTPQAFHPQTAPASTPRETEPPREEQHTETRPTQAAPPEHHEEQHTAPKPSAPAPHAAPAPHPAAPAGKPGDKKPGQ